MLLHGWGMNSAVWSSLSPYLEGQFQVINLDLPGHGQSAPLDTKVDTDAVLDAWLDALDKVLPDQCYLCGWSLGGMLALAIQQRWPDRVLGIVMLAASPRFLADASWSGISKQQLQDFADKLLENTNQTLFQFFALQFLGVPEGRKQMRDALHLLAEQGQASKQGLEQGLFLLRTLDMRSAFTGIPEEFSFAVLLGKQDKLIPVALADAMQQLLPHITMSVWPKVGHAPHLSQPQKVADFIAEALL